MLYRRFTADVAVAMSAVGLLLSPVVSTGAQARDKRPLPKVLPRFEAPDVPAIGPAETAVPPPQVSATPPEALTGAGIAQHPTLYIGEGRNTSLDPVYKPID